MLIKKKFPRHRIDFNLKELLCFFKNLARPIAIQNFEKDFVNYIQIKNAVYIPSCRWGLYHVLRKLNLGSTDEVLMPAYTFEAMPFAVVACGAKIKYVEPSQNHFNVDINVIKNATSPKTKVVIVSHLYGQSSDIKKIADFCFEKKFFLIEDCAHACGAEEAGKKLGTFGQVGLFSFGIGKNMNTLGGGMLITNSEALAHSIREELTLLPNKPVYLLFFQGIKTYIMALLTGPLFTWITFPLMNLILRNNINFFDDAVNEKVDLNGLQNNILHSCKPNSAQASLGLMKLKKLEEIRNILIERAKLYDLKLSDKVKWPFFENERNSQSLSYYVIRVRDREKIRHALLRKGIDTKSCDMNNCATLTGFDEVRKFPLSQTVKDQIVEIPNHQNMKRNEIIYIAEEINKLIKNDQEFV